MSTLYISHPACLDHQTPFGHPERPDRIRAIERALEKERFTSLVREQAPMAEMDSLALAHPEEYIRNLRDISPREGLVRIDEDTVMSPAVRKRKTSGSGPAMTRRLSSLSLRSATFQLLFSTGSILFVDRIVGRYVFVIFRFVDTGRAVTAAT